MDVWLKLSANGKKMHEFYGKNKYIILIINTLLSNLQLPWGACVYRDGYDAFGKSQIDPKQAFWYGSKNTL